MIRSSDFVSVSFAEVLMEPIFLFNVKKIIMPKKICHVHLSSRMQLCLFREEKRKVVYVKAACGSEICSPSSA